MHPLRSTVHLAPNPLDIRFPHCIGLSIRMAYIMTELNALPTNITLSHFDTSSTLAYYTLLYFLTLIYYQKYMGKASKKNFF